MERLVQHLQQIANQHDLAQLHQWLCTYMLYVQSGAYPTMETVPDDPWFSLLRGLRWKGLHLMVPERALQEVPARYLAILAVRGYLEAQARRLRKENGYPEATMEELMPPSPSDDDGHKHLSCPTIDKGEFLLRHPPDEYNKVDKVRI